MVELSESECLTTQRLNGKNFVSLWRPSVVDLIDEDQIILLEGPMKSSRGEFIREKDGTIGWLRMGGRIHKRLE